MATESTNAPAPAPAAPEPKKSESKAVEAPGGKPASNKPEHATHDENYNHRVGIVSCTKSVDITVPPEVTAGLARAKVLSLLEGEKGLKVRPVVVPGSGMTAYTIIRKEIAVPLQEKVLAGLAVIPDYINEHMKTVLIVPKKTYIAAIVVSVNVMIDAYNEHLKALTFPAKKDPIVCDMGYEENMGRLANKKREINVDLIGRVGLAFSLSFSELAEVH